MADSTKAKREPWLNWLLWWQVGPDELARQVEQYATLPFLKSARGQAALGLVLMACISGILIAVGYLPMGAAADVLIMVGLAAFVGQGQRWAHLAAMVLWTLEKAVFLIPGLMENGGNPVTHVMWWCILMHAFCLSLRVEQQRRKVEPDAASFFT